MAKVSPLESLSYSKVHSMESSEVTVTNFLQDNQVDSLQKLSDILHGDAKRIIKESYEEQKLFKWHIGLKAVFHKATVVTLITAPPPYFQTLTLECITRFGFADRGSMHNIKGSYR